MTTVLAGCCATGSGAAAMLLAVAGLAKLRRPDPAAGMLVRLAPGPARRLGRTGRRAAIRLAATAETAVALWAMLGAGRAAALGLAMSYLVLAAVATRLAGRRVACGCFGRTGTPIGRGHVVVTLAAAVSALLAVLLPGGRSFPALDLTVPAGLGVVQSVLLAALAGLVLTSLPVLLAARRAVVRPAVTE